MIRTLLHAGPKSRTGWPLGWKLERQAVVLDMRCARSSTHHFPRQLCLRRYATSGSNEGFLRSALRKLNPVNAYRETKRIVESVKEFGVSDYVAALRTAAVLEKKAESIIAKTEARDKELAREQDEFQQKLNAELKRIDVITDGMVSGPCYRSDNAGPSTTLAILSCTGRNIAEAASCL